MATKPFIVNSVLHTLLEFSGDVPSNAGDFIQFGKLTSTDGAHGLFISVVTKKTGNVHAGSKQYSFAVHNGQTFGEWFRVVALNSNPVVITNDFDIDVKTDGFSTYFRLRRVSGAEDVTHTIKVQNVGQNDDTFEELTDTGFALTPVSSISSVPSFQGTTDHNALTNRGTVPHSQIDAHIAAANPHSGHELTSRKDQPEGYAGLGLDGKLSSSVYNIGNTSGTICAGDDPRLTASGVISAHATTHKNGQSDELDLNDLAGVLPQTKTHGSSDTDINVSSLHHTLGTSSTQAAAGDHSHGAIYAPGVHNHSTDDGSGNNLVDHDSLKNRGTLTHTQLDAHVGAVGPHSGHELTASKNVNGGYAGLSAQGKIAVGQIPVGQTSITVAAGDDPRFSDSRNPLEHANTHLDGGDDPIALSSLSGSLPQSKSHGSADTDVGYASLHHTIGITSFQAAAGDHLHGGVYAPAAHGHTSTAISNSSDIVGTTVTDALNELNTRNVALPPSLDDIIGRLEEGDSYSYVRDLDGFITSISTPISVDVTKTWDIVRGAGGMVDTIHLYTSDSSYDKLYTFSRNGDGFVAGVTIS